MIEFQSLKGKDHYVSPTASDVEGKVSVSASSFPTSVEVSYRHKVTAAHWNRL